MLVLLLVGCFGRAPARECVPVRGVNGDNCDCTPNCMPKRKAEAVTEFCDLGCLDSGDGWDCEISDDGECLVVQATPAPPG